MLITVTAPKKGMGQTTTTINLAALLAKYLKKEYHNKKLILLDINKFAKDIEYYLSNTTTTKGLDDFYSLYKSKLLDMDSFKSCTKQVDQNIDIMAANEYFEIDEEVLETLIWYAQKAYPLTVIDSIGSSNIPKMSEMLFKKSDKIVVVINQIKSVMKVLGDKQTYHDYKDKIVFVVNRHMDSMEHGKIEYDVDDLKKELQYMGYNNEVFPLEFDLDIINESNYGSILNFVMPEMNEKKKYVMQLKKLTRYILKNNKNFNTLIEGEDKEKFDIFKKINVFKR